MNDPQCKPWRLRRPQIHRAPAALFPLLLLVRLLPAYSQDPAVEIAKRIPFAGVIGDNFGLNPTVSGQPATVGAYRGDDNGKTSGSVYLFERNRGGADIWQFAKKLTTSNGAAFDLFGVELWLSGDTLMVDK